MKRFNRLNGGILLVGGLTAVAAPIMAETPLPRPRPSLDALINKISGGDPAPVPLAQVPLPQPRPTGAPTRSTGNDAPPPPAAVAAPVAVSPPVSSGPIPQASRSSAKEAVELLGRDRFEQALSVQKRISDPVARKLVEFLYVRDASLHAGHARIARFLRDNPSWPGLNRVQARMESAFLSERAAPDAVLAALSIRPARTVAGHIAHARALLAKGRKQDARNVIRRLWRTTKLERSERALIMREFSGSLRRSDHRARMDFLLYEERIREAWEIAKQHLGSAERKLCDARAAVIRRNRNAGSLLRSVPSSLRSDPGYQFSNTQYLRRAGKEADAGRQLLEASKDEEALIDHKEWWSERRLNARIILEDGDTRTAYRIAADHRGGADLERMDAEFHAGWIALRFNGDAKAAYRHFQGLRRIATRPISIARAEYWLGRAAAAMRNDPAAHYTAAAQHYTTFYGQLAAVELNRSKLPAADRLGDASSARRHAISLEPVRAMVLLAEIGEKNRAAGLLLGLSTKITDARTMTGLAEILHGMDFHHFAISVGKRGVQEGMPTEYHAFSRAGLPGFKPVGNRIDPAVTYAISRQESIFDPAAISHAGARGMMQLMPGTARATAEKHGLRYSKSRLTSDAAYNVTLGTAHLGDLAKDFDGYLPFMFAAYNAGKSRVYQWVKRFGDPRSGDIDPIDWIERIPFSETRNYVMRVMEGVQVYRALLGRQELRIDKDLGLRPQRRSVLRPASPATRTASVDDPAMVEGR